jgi:hypothetical protein
MPTSHGVQWRVETRDIAKLVERGRDVHPDIRISYAADPVFLSTRIEEILSRPARDEEIDRARRIDRGIDRLDLALLLDEGVNAAGLSLMANAMAREGVSRRFDREATTLGRALSWRRLGGRIVECFPMLGAGVQKRRDVIVVDRRLPDTLLGSLGSLKGSPLSTMVTHPRLDPLGARILEAWVGAGGDPPLVYLRTDLPIVHVPMESAQWR